MRALFLLVLSTGLMVGCSSTNNGRYDRPGRASASTQARPGSAARPYVCHNGNTIAVSRNSVRSHRRHGDELGACTRRDRREARRDQRDRRDDRRGNQRNRDRRND